ncbi:hypothetical protein E2K93_09140 [Thalassotalea sp. HSM 43]|uniref:hypothetical protein n=1 Tax=Thalassotalea sp. HSM 43 TaxID=2552945 RepID=UPI00107FD74D|nr:hypothetical protein [Thalassotalea sp. HSM 43]QBY04544.1 hypothetical protein E2K93_09140 [Thalassotalea sp. HSM 43]
MDISLLDKYVPLTRIQQTHFKVKDQGCYDYTLNHQSTDLQEPWQILENGDMQIIRSVRYSRQYKVLLAVSCHITKSTQTIDLSYQEGDNPEIIAQYKIDKDGNWQVSQSHPGDIFKQQGHDPDLVIFPLLRIFSGQMLIDCKLRGQAKRQVLIPDIRPESGYNDKLKPSFDMRTSKAKGVNGRGRKFQFISEHYQEDSAQFYLNEHGQLDFYQWQQAPQKLWQVTLCKAAVSA